MSPDRERLERRREVLIGAILYVEEQIKDMSRDSSDFLAWARNELVFVDTLLRQERLLDQVLILPRSRARAFAT